MFLLRHTGLTAMTLPMFEPESKWVPPNLSELPDYRKAKLIAIDTETCDPNLLTMGPGFLRGESYVVGISLAAEGFPAIYLPIRHEGGGNLDFDRVISYIADMLSTNTPKLGANILYDIDSLNTLGINIGGAWNDIQIAEPLINEHLPVSLAALSRKYLGLSKDETLLREAAATFNIDPKGELWKLPAKFVGPYAEADARLPLEIFRQQKEILTLGYLDNLYQLETDLLKVIWAMRKQGIRIDLNALDRLNNEWDIKIESMLKELENKYPFKINLWESKFLQRVAEYHNLNIPYTAKGNPSLTNNWLLGNPYTKLIGETRQLVKMKRDFIEGGLVKYLNGDRIHAQFHSLRKEKGGTISGRFSSSNPNLQQIPARHPIFGKALRSLFIAEEGEHFVAADYSGQELRIASHYAYMSKAPGSVDLFNAYKANINLDLHQYIADIAGIDRRTAKTVSFLILYGGGPTKLMFEIKCDEDHARNIFKTYNEAFPAFRYTAELATSRAEERGYVKTILGRYRHFNPGDAYYKAFNSIIQGSAADQTKQAMVNLSQEGIVPLGCIHDELIFSIDDLKKIELIKEIMEQAIQFRIDHVVDIKSGSNWSQCK